MDDIHVHALDDESDEMDTVLHSRIHRKKVIKKRRIQNHRRKNSYERAVGTEIEEPFTQSMSFKPFQVPVRKKSSVLSYIEIMSSAELRNLEESHAHSSSMTKSEFPMHSAKQSPESLADDSDSDFQLPDQVELFADPDHEHSFQISQRTLELEDENTSWYNDQLDVMIEDIYDTFDYDSDEGADSKIPPPFKCGPCVSDTECNVCFDGTNVRLRLCCNCPVCDNCMNTYIEDKVSNRTVTCIPCIGCECDAFVNPDEVLGRLSGPAKEKYYSFLADINQDPFVKTCPGCSAVFDIMKKAPNKATILKSKSRKRKKGVHVVCPTCSLPWCFMCQAPWHTGITCKEFIRGNKLLKDWAKTNTHGQANAHKCPRCKIFIERNGGCNHMTCSHCSVSFCYRCGERYYSLKMIGDHHGTFSPFGCKYNLMPNRPAARKFVRGSILGAKVLGGVLLGGLVVAAGALFIGTSVIILPVYGGYKYAGYRKRRKWVKQRMLRHQLRNQYNNRTAPPTILIPRDRHLPVILPNDDTDLNTLDFLSASSSSDADSEVHSLFTSSLTDDEQNVGKLADLALEEVEVWVHSNCQPSPNRQEVDSALAQSSNTDTETNSGVRTCTTAKLKMGSGDEDVLHVRTRYASTKSEKDKTKKQDSDQDNEPFPQISTCQDDNENRDIATDYTILRKDSGSDDCDTEHSTEEYNQETTGVVAEEEENGFVIADDGSSVQGCFVRIFGKKLQVPVMWDKDKDGESRIPSDPDKMPVDVTSNSLEKKKNTSITVGTQEKIKSRDGTLEKKKRGLQIVSDNQPDIVNCALRAEQSNKAIMLSEIADCVDEDGRSEDDVQENSHKGEATLVVDPHYGLVSTENFDTSL